MFTKLFLLLILIPPTPPSLFLLPLIQSRKEVNEKKFFEKTYNIEGYVELNHVYNEDWIFLIDQYIVWKWYPDLGEYHVAAFYVANGRKYLGDEEYNKLLSEFIKENKLDRLPEDINTEVFVDRRMWIGDKNFRVKKKDGKTVFIYNTSQGELKFNLDCYTESHTNYDKEVEDRKKLNKDLRFLPNNFPGR